MTQTVFESKLLGERYVRFSHPCGLPIYVFPKKMSTAHALFATHFGSVDGGADFPAGIAHFLEHKLFSNEDGSDSFECFSAFGADANAYTSHTRTVYLFSATDRFYDSLGELIDFVTHPYFTPQTVEKEQGIIGEEIRMCRDNPYDKCYYSMLDGLYFSHPVKTEICGSISSIAKITDKTLYDCYRAYYRPSNMALVVCGDVDPEEVFRFADAHLPLAWGDDAVKRSFCDEPPRAHRALVESVGQVAKPIFAIGVKECDIPQDLARREAAMAVLCEMLFSQSGELYESLFERGLISPDFSAEYALTRGFGFLQIAGEADDPRAVYDEICAYLARKAREGLSREDFERCRRVEFSEYIKSFDSTEEIANALLSFAFDGASLFEYADIINSLTFEEIGQLFAAFFEPSRFTLSVVYPQEKKGE